ncbi:MAG: SCO family protein [Nitrospiraceae bacterium]|nr:SCO family protein [Nitrospiraceae bacterium]
MRLRILTVILAGLLCVILLHTHASAGQDVRSPEVGIDEHLGGTLPLDTFFTDEQGRKVLLRDLVTKPTILTFVYYRCTHTCPTLLLGLSDVLSKIDLSPGKDYSVISISFDETETPDLAGQKKKDYIKATGKAFPEGAWRFLTADRETIERITGAAGFGFKRVSTGFAHPVALIVLSPRGKITRYLYGVRFLPMDLTLALTEASKGLAVPTVNRVLLYCFSYDPEGKRYVFNILKITGIATILFAALFIGWLTRWGKKQP